MPQHPRNILNVGFGCRREFAILCAVLLVFGDLNRLSAQTAADPPKPAEEKAPKLTSDQLDSLVAPIALYPDPLLSQTLVACTYPLEIVQLQQWLTKNPKLKDKELAEAVKKQNWDPSIQAMAGLPDVLKRLADDIKWSNDLGNAFLSQQDEVMDAVQRMRKKAADSGNLKSSEQQKVETKVVENKTVIVVEQANPQVVYVPSYNPTVVYGPPVYPYPPIYYPPPGYYAAGMAISFGVGVAMGAFWSGGWGYHCGWHGGGNNIYINNNNNFVNHNNIQNVNRSGNRTNVGNTNWQHNPQHRGGAPYSDRTTANRYGGSARGESLQSRQANAGTADRGGVGGGNRSPQAGTADRGAGGLSSNRGGGDRVGDRSVQPSTRPDNRSAFGGSSSSISDHSARASSNRGSSSMSSSRGGSGGFRGGGSRGGGGRRR